MSGYEDFMTDNEYLSVLPWPILHCIADWLDATHPEDAGAESAVETAVETVIESNELMVDDPTAGRLTGFRPPHDRVVEQTVRIADRYFAVVSRPATAPARRVAIVLANTGTMTRIGSARLHVGLARYWASMGFTVVRVDLAGCGDTIDDDPETETNPVAPVRIEELSEVLAAVRQWPGFERLVVGGLCSGSYNAFQVATRGLEIDDLFLANPAAFYIEQGASDGRAIASAYSLTQGFFNARKWKAAFVDPETRRRGLQSVRKLFAKNALPGLRVLAVEALRNWARRLGLPVKASSRLSRDLEAMNGRGVRVLMVFTAGELADMYFHTVGGSACEALLDGDDVSLVDIDGGDHTFASPAARERLFGVLTSHLEDRYGPAPTAARQDPALADPEPVPAPAKAVPPSR
jgi:GNAT superfamily N-acetyltransferase